MTARPDFYRLHNGQQSVLPFEDAEYVARLAELRERMDAQGAAAAVFTSMHNIAYYSGFLCVARCARNTLGKRARCIENSCD